MSAFQNQYLDIKCTEIQDHVFWTFLDLENKLQQILLGSVADAVGRVEGKMTSCFFVLGLPSFFGFTKDGISKKWRPKTAKVHFATLIFLLLILQHCHDPGVFGKEIVFHKGYRNELQVGAVNELKKRDGLHQGTWYKDHKKIFVLSNIGYLRVHRWTIRRKADLLFLNQTFKVCSLHSLPILPFILNLGDFCVFVWNIICLYAELGRRVWIWGGDSKTKWPPHMDVSFFSAVSLFPPFFQKSLSSLFCPPFCGGSSPPTKAR